MMKYSVSLRIFVMVLLTWSWAASLSAQHYVVTNTYPQQAFPEHVPAANYSGITWLGDTLYAVVNDKASDDGYELFSITLDSLSGQLLQVRHLQHVTGNATNRDQEGIAYLPASSTLLVSGEKDNRILEYTLDAVPTGRQISLPKTASNYGYEALSFEPVTQTIWTVSEATLPEDGPHAVPLSKDVNQLRIKSFDKQLNLIGEYPYVMDPPTAPMPTSHYAQGVSALAAIDSTTLFVLEREVFVPDMALGAYAHCRLYEVSLLDFEPAAQGESTSFFSAPLPKKLLTEWRTHISLFQSTLANYEGLCVGPTLPDGSRVLILLADSQDQYAGVLQDWFKTIVVKSLE